LKIFQTGAITITAPSISNVQLAVEHIYPLVYEFRKDKPQINDNSFLNTNTSKRKIKNDKKRIKRTKYNDSSEEESSSDEQNEQEDGQHLIMVEDYYSDKDD